MSEIAILEAFTDLPDPRRTAGQRHEKAMIKLCFFYDCSMFTCDNIHR